MADAKFGLTLMVDKDKNRVVFAESDEDFMNILLSFLTMPMGTLIRLAGKQSRVGCMDTLYESVENLDFQYLQTEACKSMLLRPRGASEIECMKLPLQLKDTKVTDYICPNFSSSTKTHNFISTASNARCRCGKVMDTETFPIVDGEKGKEGVFVKGNGRFMISDDLRVTPVSTMTSLSLIKSLGIRDMTAFEEINLNTGADKVLDLLKCLLVSKMPMSDVFLSKRETTDAVKVEQRDIAPSQMGRVAGSDNKKMRVKLLISASNDKVLYAEAGEDFIDLLFSFLTLPVGSVVKLLGKCSSIGCVDNLYKSVEDLSANGLINCNDTAKLINPKLAAHFCCENNLLQIEEAAPRNPTNGSGGPILHAINPKSRDGITESGGGFVKGPVIFTVTDDLDVKPFSPTRTISFIKKFNLPLSDIEEQVVNVGEEEALDLLKASFISKMVLNDVFSPRKRKEVGMVIDKDKDSCAKLKMETIGSCVESCGKIKLETD
ncbi:uncharacterized protein LOC143858558 [Tasmannia lanceolata]|uniref:uncharacterized protein LOC143858558 n=1 Tax=Tasmannia lanceolata TaxID=3420 RepID=UPI00406385FE